MNRRRFCGATVGLTGLISGCSQPTITENPTGELDVRFTTEASEEYTIRFRIVDADGNTEDEFESGFPPDEEGAPSYYSAGLSNGPYTITIGTETERERFEWSITECPRHVVDVTIRPDGAVDIERRCSGQ